MIIICIGVVQINWWNGVKGIHIINKKNKKDEYSYEYLGVYVDSALSWSTHIDCLCSKVQRQIYFLRRLRSFGANKQIIILLVRFL